jgi:hypothetical protein
MKKLFVISSVLIAFSAVNLFANDSNAVNNGKLQAITTYKTAIADTVPKKDTTKKKDTTSFQLKERK